jgi:hypothetical protein
MDFNDFTLELMADSKEMDFLEDAPVFYPVPKEHSGSDIDKNVEFFYYPGICCPVDGCPPALVYTTKASFQRHWTEKHLPEVISYLCPVGFCKVSCRRRYDLKIHLFRIHNTSKDVIESVLSKSCKSAKANPAFVTPSPWAFFGRTSKNDSGSVPVSLNVDPLPAVSRASVPSVPSPSPASLPVDTVLRTDVPESASSPPRKRVLSLKEYQSRSHSEVSRPLDAATQTRCQDLPPFQFPDMPATREEIHSYIHWLDMLSDSIQHQRRAAERKLQDATTTSPEMLAEREKRRKLEAENLRLRKELADLKAVNLLFPEL